MQRLLALISGRSVVAAVAAASLASALSASGSAARRLDTEGSAQLGYLVNLFARRGWFRLVPDLGHRIVTKGYGTFAPNRNVASSDCVTAAATPDGRLAIAYLPEGGTIGVDTRRMAGRVHASWHDPTSGAERTVKGSPFAARRSLDLIAPSRNHGGDRDWVLVLTAA